MSQREASTNLWLGTTRCNQPNDNGRGKDVGAPRGQRGGNLIIFRNHCPSGDREHQRAGLSFLHATEFSLQRLRAWVM